MPEISIIIPTLNEEKNLKKLLPEIGKIMKGQNYEIIVVDGHSSDRTVEVAKALKCRVVYESEGKGNALLVGFRKAKGSIIVMMDADLSHRPKELKLLIESIRAGYDGAFGSRFLLGGGTNDMTFIRKIGNKLFIYLVNLLWGAHYSDLCYGYRAFKKSALRRLQLTEKGFGIETEMSIEASEKGLKIIEIPSFEKKREKGAGKLRTFRDGWAILRTIIRKMWERVSG